MALTITPTVRRRDGTVQVMFSQSAAAAADEMVAAPGAGQRIVVISVLASLDVAGSFQLLSAANALTGAIALGAGVPFGWRGSVRQPMLECNANEALKLTTVTGKATGVLIYKITQAS